MPRPAPVDWRRDMWEVLAAGHEQEEESARGRGTSQEEGVPARIVTLASDEEGAAGARRRQVLQQDLTPEDGMPAPHNPSLRSRSRSASLGGASDDSEVQKRWRAEEASWRRNAATAPAAGSEQDPDSKKRR
eukprot:gnl/TRDRNA2_/TRDRNA2_176307_c13_seq4.p1 gnl/TRDRNA2_/TRDRNA2_176307_c13~~gnl/TRDRNA2_/TRDRNA2_176307_c13_seq4.p1  ORF type:complete len:132 (-),score=26.86 gnl/TRDRNA2_/TRDRNA2_176307_c13_seq4:33-428(-)